MEFVTDNRSSSALGIVVERVDDLDAAIKQIKAIVTLSEEQISVPCMVGSRRLGEAIVLADNLAEADIAALAVNRHRLHGVEVITDSALLPQAEIAAHAVGSVRA